MHATVSLARLTAAAFAVTALCAGTATADTRSFTLDIDGGALSLSGTFAAEIPDGIVINGTVDDRGTVAVQPASMSFPTIDVPGLFNATITPVGVGTGTFNDLSGNMTLDLPLRLVITGGSAIPKPCEFGTSVSPIRLRLKSWGASVPVDAMGDMSPSARNPADGAIRLTDPSPLPGAADCAGLETLAQGLGIGLIGKLAIPAKQAPPTNNNNGGGGTPQPPAPAGPITATVPSTTKPAVKKLSRLRLTAPAKQKGIKSGGAVLGIEVDQPAKAVLNASVKIAGVKKAAKLKAVRRNLKTGRASVAVSFPKALRSKVQRALRTRKRVVVTIKVTATDAAGTRITRSRQIRLTR